MAVAAALLLSVGSPPIVLGLFDKLDAGQPLGDAALAVERLVGHLQLQPGLSQPLQFLEMEFAVSDGIRLHHPTVQNVIVDVWEPHAYLKSGRRRWQRRQRRGNWGGGRDASGGWEGMEREVRNSFLTGRGWYAMRRWGVCYRESFFAAKHRAAAITEIEIFLLLQKSRCFCYYKNRNLFENNSSEFWRNLNCRLQLVYVRLESLERKHKTDLFFK